MRKARIAVLGAGWWGCQVYVPVLLADPRVDLVAVNRRDPEALARIQAEFGIARGYADFRALLAAEKPDGVVIASPHTVHFAQGMAALECGAHVLVDKPMTTDAREARALVARAQAAGRQIVVPYGWNFKDFTRRAAELVRGGAVGEVRHVLCHMASPTEDLFGGAGLVETEGHMFRPAVSTWADPANAGGYGWGQLSHALGLMFGVTGLEPAEVYGIAGRSPAGVDYYDAVSLRFANGATGAVSGASTVPKHCGYQVDLRVFGTEGMLLLDVERERMEVRRRDGADVVLHIEPGAGAYACVESVTRLVDYCTGLTPPNEASGEVGLRAVEVLDAMYRSFASGRTEVV